MYSIIHSINQIVNQNIGVSNGVRTRDAGITILSVTTTL